MLARLSHLCSTTMQGCASVSRRCVHPTGTPWHPQPSPAGSGKQMHPLGHDLMIRTHACMSCVQPSHGIAHVRRP